MVSKKFLISVAVILIAANALIFLFQERRAVVEYKDSGIFLIGDSDPIAEMAELVNSSTHVILLAEGDLEKTQRNTHIDAALIQLARDLHNKDPEIYGLKFQNKNAVNCGNFSVDYCQSLKPDSDSFMLIIRYPDSLRDEIEIRGRTIEMRAKTGLHVLALMRLFQILFL